MTARTNQGDNWPQKGAKSAKEEYGMKVGAIVWNRLSADGFAPRAPFCGHSLWLLLKNQIPGVSATEGTNHTKKNSKGQPLLVSVFLLWLLCHLWPMRLRRFQTAVICQEIAR
jgi:hypothetical protein